MKRARGRRTVGATASQTPQRIQKLKAGASFPHFLFPRIFHQTSAVLCGAASFSCAYLMRLVHEIMIFVELTEEVEKKFFQALASLKTKDPRIYDEKTVFFSREEKKNEDDEKKKKKKKTETKITLGDLERKIMLEKVT
jgi:hypothetical protein